MAKRTILLTGASGSMGSEAFHELLRRTDRLSTRLLLRPSKVNKKQFARYDGRDGVEIVWGDLTNSDDVHRAVSGVDVVLHPAAMISPAADRYPEMARKINVGGTLNLIAAIKAQPGGAENIPLVYVASVAQYGDRLPPIEWINVGDPLRPSVHDYYALTKMEAETAVIESGLRYWVSMRQTYIAIPNTLSLLDPILFHQPLDQRIELITNRDAGYGLVQTIDAPDEFWCRVYNMSGGPSCRVTYLDYMEQVFTMLGLGGSQQIFERNWFALQNFHCGYYQDSDVLNGYLGHFRDSLEDHLKQLDDAFPRWMKIGGSICPKPLIKAYMKRMSDPLRWIEQGNDAYVDAFFGSRDAWEAIPGWDGAPIKGATSEPPDASHVFQPEDMSFAALEAFAASRGGTCEAQDFSDPAHRLEWSCAHGHRFEASPRLLVSAGYWCPTCAPRVDDLSGWDYGAKSEKDPLLAAFV
ncbi:MAG: NAD-dependent epimerase/dehydratase family protein [Deltaproteobacteria bacterium]|nr:NAD-dependent epimerase/dehydratase family protein [Deltaproteobacteria bacterium]MBW2724751.1 NAD-dependent epimerase/dehydratase family protein [Deltaproteobacteria bacterium]